MISRNIFGVLIIKDVVDKRGEGALVSLRIVRPPFVGEILMRLLCTHVYERNAIALFKLVIKYYSKIGLVLRVDTSQIEGRLF